MNKTLTNMESAIDRITKALDERDENIRQINESFGRMNEIIFNFKKAMGE